MKAIKDFYQTVEGLDGTDYAIFYKNENTEYVEIGDKLITPQGVEAIVTKLYYNKDIGAIFVQADNDQKINASKLNKMIAAGQITIK